MQGSLYTIIMQPGLESRWSKFRQQQIQDNGFSFAAYFLFYQLHTKKLGTISSTIVRSHGAHCMVTNHHHHHHYHHHCPRGGGGGGRVSVVVCDLDDIPMVSPAESTWSLARWLFVSVDLADS